MGTNQPLQLAIRAAAPGDIPTILTMIRELAEFEHLSHEVRIDEAALRNAMFAALPPIEVFLGLLDGTAVSYLAFSTTFSTFSGKPRMYVEDLYVKAQFRRRGIGKAMLARAARLALDRGYKELQWSALKWNLNAIDLYLKLGARPIEEWTYFSLSGEELTRLASKG